MHFYLHNVVLNQREVIFRFLQKRRHGSSSLIQTTFLQLGADNFYFLVLLTKESICCEQIPCW